MRRALSIFGVAGLIGLIVYLLIINQLAEERAARFERALLEAEDRIAQLESEIDLARRQLAELKRNQDSPRSEGSFHRNLSVAVPTIVSPGQSAAFGSIADRGEIVVTRSSASAERAPGPWVGYSTTAAAGSSNVVRIEGTSSIHNWQVESHLITGSAEFGAGFPAAPGIQAQPGLIDAKVRASVLVRSLKSVTSDGEHYSGRMDEIHV